MTQPLSSTDRAALTLGGPFAYDEHDHPIDSSRYLERPLNVLTAEPHLEHTLELYTVDELALAGWALHLPWPTNPLPMNKRRHGHWAVEAASVRKVRGAAAYLAEAIPPQPRIRIRLDWEVTTLRTRDEDNLVKAMKALTDGLRDAAVIPDDTRRHVLREMPQIHYAPKDPARRPAAFMRLWILKVNPD